MKVIVMSYYARGDIASALMEGDTMVMGFLSNQGFACAIAQLCIGLDHIHSMKIAHRDIKLDNIFISDQGQLVVRILFSNSGKTHVSRRYNT